MVKLYHSFFRVAINKLYGEFYLSELTIFSSLVETYFGKFSRSFTLPDNADIANIEASSDNGVLEVIIPKLKEDNNKKSITVK